jgi:hypothetical protein
MNRNRLMRETIRIGDYDTGVHGGVFRLGAGQGGGGFGGDEYGYGGLQSTTNRMGALAERNPEDMANTAAIDTEAQYANAQGATNRRLAEMGVNPSAGKYVGINTESAINKAAMKAGNMVRARRQAELDNFNRLNQLAGQQRGNIGLMANVQNQQANQRLAQQGQDIGQQQYYNSRLDLANYEKGYGSQSNQQLGGMSRYGSLNAPVQQRSSNMNFTASTPANVPGYTYNTASGEYGKTPATKSWSNLFGNMPSYSRSSRTL